eukprot:COSAG02_NODE_1426_length_12664_cov_6.226980_10_plen_86_part_00
MNVQSEALAEYVSTRVTGVVETGSIHISSASAPFMLLFRGRFRQTPGANDDTGHEAKAHKYARTQAPGPTGMSVRDPLGIRPHAR